MNAKLVKESRFFLENLVLTNEGSHKIVDQITLSNGRVVHLKNPNEYSDQEAIFFAAELQSWGQTKQ